MALDHLLGSGGKRIRPALVLLSAHLCGADMDQAIFPAAAVEMLHTATLIHDDLIDDSLMRRGMETLNSHWPPAATVLTGDYIFARAAHLAAQIDNVRLMQRFAETLMTDLDDGLLVKKLHAAGDFDDTSATLTAHFIDLKFAASQEAE